MIKKVIIAVFSLVFSGCSSMTNEVIVAACHMEGQFGNVGYSVDVEMRRPDEQLVQYRVTNLKALWIPLERLDVNHVAITNVMLIATKKTNNGLGSWEKIWSDSISVDIPLSQTSAAVEVGELTFSIPKKIFINADHVGLAFADDDGMWPVDAGLRQMHMNNRNLGGICPGNPIEEPESIYPTPETPA